MSRKEKIFYIVLCGLIASIGQIVVYLIFWDKITK